jgi:hypothetical protein
VFVLSPQMIVDTGEARHVPLGRIRHEALDSARLLATLGVIWTHVTEVQGQSYGAAALGRFGTSYYILLAIFFSVRSRIARPLESMSTVIKVRLRRLMLPYVLWSLLYGGLYIRYGLSIGASWHDMMIWWGPFAGTARHLWFLPFAAFAGTYASFATRFLLKMSIPALATLFGVSTLFWYWLFDGVFFFALDRPWELSWHLHRLDRWIEEVPLVLSATPAIVLFHKAREVRERNQETEFMPRSFYGLFAFVGFCLVEWFYFEKAEVLRPFTGGESRMVAHTAGALLLMAALLSTKVSWIKRAAPLARHTYFVFLAHVVALDALSPTFHRMSGFGTVWFSALCTLGIYVLCAAVGPIVKKMPGLRYMYPGV